VQSPIYLFNLAFVIDEITQKVRDSGNGNGEFKNAHENPADMCTIQISHRFSTQKQRRNAARVSRCCSDTESRRIWRKLNASAPEMTSATSTCACSFQRNLIVAAERSRVAILSRCKEGIDKSCVPRWICHLRDKDRAWSPLPDGICGGF